MRLRTALIGIAIAIAIFKTDPVDAATIETLVMPGEVIEGHAEWEPECSSCHEAFERANQRTLCLDCHEDVAADIETGSGFHGLFDDATNDECVDCHTDHEGRDADIVQLDENAFEHDFTDFPLLGGHIEVPCEDCHSPDEKFRDAPGDCLSCHEEDNVHGEFMGTECADCHSATGWLEVEFDHDTTDYPLLGKHLETPCLDCHEDRTFQGAPTTCFGCHAEDDAHDGRSGEECDNCHKPTDWTDTSFDHNRDTDFFLEGRHADLTCDDCHSEDPFADEMETTCVSCHLEDDNHGGHFGDACDTCHVSEEWITVVFDHDVDTEHPLIGAHEEVECEACHIEPIFDVALHSACNDCHAEDDAHEGEQGIQCSDCHNEASWQDDVFFDHDLTRFPLLGKHADEECESCHESHVFRDASTVCVDCHLEEDPHEGRYHDNCAACHNPVDWPEWQFDHNSETDFILDGAHITVACDDCHRQSLAALSKLGGRCGDCHRADDIHDGEFGFDCARCHSAESFKDVRSIQ